MSPFEPGELLLLHPAISPMDSPPALRRVSLKELRASMDGQIYIELPRDIIAHMALQHLRERSRELRKLGKSIAEIAQELPASKSSVSHWCRDIVLSKTQLSELAKKQLRAGAAGRLRAAEQKRAARLERVKNDMRRGALDVGTLSRRDLFILGIGLYWGEGYKNGNDECGLTNSDPSIVCAFIAWLQATYSVDRSDLILRVSIHETHRDRKLEVERYWSDATGIPLSQFTATSFIRARSKKVFRKLHEHFGTLRVKVRRGTSLRRRIMGSIDKLRTEFKKQN